MICVPDADKVACIYCGRKWIASGQLFFRTCCKGPGDHLHALILKWFSEGPTRQCGCEDRINQMNAWGPQGCREHLDEIIGWLVEQAEKHDWGNNPMPKLARLSRWIMQLPGGTKPIEMVCRQMVLAAIRKAERLSKCPS